MSESIYDVLRTFHIRKNVEMGMTQKEWIDLLDALEKIYEGDEE